MLSGWSVQCEDALATVRDLAVGAVGPPGVVLNFPTDGSDVTDLVNTELAAIRSGSTVIIPPGRYYTPRTIKIVGLQGLTLETEDVFFWSDEKPAGSTRQHHEDISRHLDIRESADITINGLNIEGANADGDYVAAIEQQHAFAIHNSDRVTLNDCWSSFIFGDGVYVGGGAYGQSTDIEISRQTVRRNGRQGIALTWVDGVLIDEADIRGSRRSGIDLEPNISAHTVTNVEVKNCRMASRLLAFPSGGRGQVSNIDLHHNRIVQTGASWVYVKASDGTRRHNWRVADNVVSWELGSPYASNRYWNVDGLEIARNQVNHRPSRYMTALEANDCTDVTLEDNCFYGAAHLLWSGTTVDVNSGNKIGTECEVPT